MADTETLDEDKRCTLFDKPKRLQGVRGRE
jgi:hypothetical protein